MGRKKSGEKNCVNFKLHFTKFHKRLRISKTTADNAGYGAVNNAIMQETATHLANLAHNTAADCNIVASISETNAGLVAEIAAANATLAVAVADIAALRLQITGMESGGRGRGRRGGRGSFQQHPGGREQHPPRTIRRHNNSNYCHSCGYDIQEWHTSATYPWRKPNHVVDATKTDNKGGSQKNKTLVQ